MGEDGTFCRHTPKWILERCTSCPPPASRVLALRWDTGLIHEFLACDGTVCLAAWLRSLGLFVVAGEEMRNVRTVSVNQVGVVHVPPGSQTCFCLLSHRVDDQWVNVLVMSGID